ncbi:Hypothetical protein FKW44_004809, partial [Caligus rogercresseyi]
MSPLSLCPRRQKEYRYQYPAAVQGRVHCSPIPPGIPPYMIITKLNGMGTLQIISSGTQHYDA